MFNKLDEGYLILSYAAMYKPVTAYYRITASSPPTLTRR